MVIKKSIGHKADKYRAKTQLQNLIYGLYESDNEEYSDNDNNLSDNEYINIKRERIKQINNGILEYMAVNLITKEEGDNLINQIQPYLNSILATQTKKNFNDDGGWFHFSIGKKELDNDINNILKQMDIKTNIKDIKNEKEKLIYYRVNNFIYDSYINSMNSIFKREKQLNPQKYININTWQDFYKQLTYRQRKQLYNEARLNTLKSFAIGEEINIPTEEELNKLSPKEQEREILERLHIKKQEEYQEEIMNMINN